MKICPRCNTKHERPGIYCSKSCSSASSLTAYNRGAGRTNSSHTRKPSVTKICPKCGATHEKPGIYCSQVCSNSHVRTEESKRRTSQSVLDNLRQRGIVPKAERPKKPPRRIGARSSKEIYETRFARAIAYLGGKCNRCGSIDRLQFDHTDSRLKSFGITENLSRRWSVLKPELDKCQLLCFPCHVAKTQEIDRPLWPKHISVNRGKRPLDSTRRLLSDALRRHFGHLPLTDEEWEEREAQGTGIRLDLPPGRQRASHIASEATRIRISESLKNSWRKRKKKIE